MLAANPVGTSFLLHAGVYFSQPTLMPRPAGDHRGARHHPRRGRVTADGVGRAVANDITIRGLTIRNYTNACVNWGADGWGRRWTIEDVDAGYCKLGVKVKKGGIYRDNYIHHNLQYGMEGTGEFDLVVEGNEIAFNRTDTSWDPGDSGGTKFHSTVGMVVRDNYVHDNNGIGIWLDGPNTGAVIEGNLVVDNDQAGIVHELGYSPVIRNNTVEGNVLRFRRLGGEGAGILAFSVRDAEIHGNVVTGNRNGSPVGATTAASIPTPVRSGCSRTSTCTTTSSPWMRAPPGSGTTSPASRRSSRGEHPVRRQHLHAHPVERSVPALDRCHRRQRRLGPSPSPAGGRTSHWTATTSAMARSRPSSAPAGSMSSWARRGRT